MIPSVRKSVVVHTPIDRAFAAFTEGLDSWWPKSHHIGTPPLERSVLEPRAGGRVYGLWGGLIRLFANVAEKEAV